MVIVALINIEKIDLKDIEKYSQLLTREKQDKWKRYAFEKDKVRNILGELLVSLSLKKHYKITRNLEIGKNEFGKPYLKNYDNLFFNITHSGDWVGCVISEMENGIDIEEIKKAESSVANLVFSKKERELYGNTNDKTNWFFNQWTLKESYIKAVGKGFSMNLQNFSILDNKGELVIVSNDFDTNYNFFLSDLDGTHKMAVCYRSLEKKDVKTVEFTLEDFEEFLM